MLAVAQSEVIKAADGTLIYVRFWPASKAKGQILLAHGHGEHSGRYEYVAQRLNAQGWDVIAPDHRGHGKSEGVRGHTPRWSDYVDDLHRAAQRFGRPELPRAILGHSMGGLIAVSYALTHGDSLRALVLTGPLLKLALPVPLVKALVGRIFSNLVPALSLPTGLDSKAVSRDADVVAAYEQDQLVHDKASSRWFTEMLAAMEAAHAGAASLPMPVLVFHGEADRLTHIEGSRTFCTGLTHPDSRFQGWTECYHEIMNEPEKEQVLDEIIAWLAPHMKRK